MRKKIAIQRKRLAATYKRNIYWWLTASPGNSYSVFTWVVDNYFNRYLSTNTFFVNFRRWGLPAGIAKTHFPRDGVNPCGKWSLKTTPEFLKILSGVIFSRGNSSLSKKRLFQKGKPLMVICPLFHFQTEAVLFFSLVFSVHDGVDGRTRASGLKWAPRRVVCPERSDSFWPRCNSLEGSGPFWKCLKFPVTRFGRDTFSVLLREWARDVPLSAIYSWTCRTSRPNRSPSSYT